MSLRNLRSFTILLVLELAVLESQVESFTLQRSKDTTDNVQAKSTVLEVLNKSTGNVKPIEIQTTQMVPTQTSPKTEEVQKNVAPTTNTTGAPNANATSTSSPVMTTDHKESNTSSDTVSSSESPSSSKTSTSTSNTSTDSTTPGNLLKYSKEETPVPAASSTIENVHNVTTKGNETAKLKSENLVTGENLNSTKNLNITNQINATEVVTANKINSTENVNSTSPVTSTNSTDKFNDTNVNIPMKNITTDLNLFANNTISKGIKLKTEENSTTSYSTKPVAINNKSNDMNNTKDGNQNTTDDSNKSNTEKQAEQSEATEGTASSTEAFTSDTSGGTTLPYWKKYTTIERKRVNTTKDAENNTVKDQDLLQAGTAQSQTTMSLEKALDIVADIPSLEQLKNDLIALNKMTSTTESTVSTESLSTKGTPKVDINSSESSTSSEATTQGFNVFSSKRAGYLDFSSRSENNKETNKTQETMDNKTNKTEETIYNRNKTKIQDKSNVTEVPSNYSSSTPPMTTPKKVPEKSMTSQSQLAEDEIQEELMKEEILLDNVENAKRLQVDRFGARTTTTGPKAESSSSSSEDKLRVRPISAEKKNGSLYAVNPNYKPLKKIEVQPSKPFVRNPDDNSWRNESLSSRGIVFKANNSSKPFTQVLKNITETKLNSLLENDNKGDEPELRTRLEKIAEMRKTKKKKVNALGETVYTDYEEPTSVENSNSSNAGSLFEFKTKDISAFLDQIEMKKPATTRGYNFDAVELTTKKSQKQIDDYEDDDDEDYTLPNIDLKKYFTPTSAPVPAIPSMSAGPLTSALPLPSRTYSPDRRPTVQYFPPRDKPQKVNINDYDTIFQQKINSYTTNIAPTKFTTPAPKSPPSEVTFDFPKIKAELQNKPNPKRPQQMDRNVYLTQPPQFQRNRIANPPRAQNGAGYNDPPYVIKHLRDFFDEMVKAEEAPPATVVPLQGITANEIAQNTKIPKDYFDYETQFRKDVINRFVENFNQNSERFKADYPVLYNTSVVHASGLPGGGDAESTAFMKRLYDDIRAFQPKDAPRRYDPNCDRTVELSPAYELHYYVPEEEEKQVVELKPAPRPISRLRL